LNDRFTTTTYITNHKSIRSRLLEIIQRGKTHQFVGTLLLNLDENPRQARARGSASAAEVGIVRGVVLPAARPASAPAKCSSLSLLLLASAFAEKEQPRQLSRDCQKQQITKSRVVLAWETQRS